MAELGTQWQQKAGKNIDKRFTYVYTYLYNHVREELRSTLEKLLLEKYSLQNVGQWLVRETVCRPSVAVNINVPKWTCLYFEFSLRVFPN